LDRDIDQINVIPLVDVMLVLPAIILTTASFIVTGQVPVAQAPSWRQVAVTIPSDYRVKSPTGLSRFPHRPGGGWRERPQCLA
jgi:biopolymer transport protein ExbD